MCVLQTLHNAQFHSKRTEYHDKTKENNNNITNFMSCFETISIFKTLKIFTILSYSTVNHPPTVINFTRAMFDQREACCSPWILCLSLPFPDSMYAVYVF